MLAYQIIDDLHCPIVICDACGKQITGMGNVYWQMPPGQTTTRQVWHPHKWPCSALDQEIEERTGEPVMSEELDVWLIQIANNFRPKAG